MKLDEWLATIPIRQTKKGARLDLRLYVYPDGHGNFYVDDEGGTLETDGQPVGDPEQAKVLLEKLWNRAAESQSAPEATVSAEPTIAERFGDLIGCVTDLPEDMAEQHDHYIHGTPKR